jgi:hypothetical protein
MTTPPLPPLNVALVGPHTAPAGTRALFDDIQDVMGVPWVAALWQAYAAYPGVLRLFWRAVRPVTASAAFLDATLDLTRVAHASVARWYEPGPAVLGLALPPTVRRQVTWELDAFEYGNPQLLLQQHMIVRALSREPSSSAAPPPLPSVARGVSAFRRPEIRMVGDDEAPAPVRGTFERIRAVLGLPVVNSDYRALAKWPDLLAITWSDIEGWFGFNSYLALRAELSQTATAMAGAVMGEVELDPAEVRNALSESVEWHTLERLMALFAGLLPGLIVNVAMIRRAVDRAAPVSPRAAEGAPFPAVDDGAA